ncbi:hypothetical protein GOBAR_AA31818 [Gossypium barbadense]|uniref:Uncharacterized protein n=1 Tax=Gossypium barbadense TaxID=3634 RepID=A0A2P5WCQ2_GOSBA|nr:hypothetical protein GOBAR_AA31818 [Gossypium barbadense]
MDVVASNAQASNSSRKRLRLQGRSSSVREGGGNRLPDQRPSKWPIHLEDDIKDEISIPYFVPNTTLPTLDHPSLSSFPPLAILSLLVEFANVANPRTSTSVLPLVSLSAITYAPYLEEVQTFFPHSDTISMHASIPLLLFQSDNARIKCCP